MSSSRKGGRYSPAHTLSAVPVVPVAAWLIFLATGPAAAQEALPSFAEPGVSPDGTEIAFVSGGDIWTVSSEGGAARLLVAHSAHESRPLYSPDGTRIAFNSNRNGGLDVFLMDLATGDVTRLTHSSSSEQLNGWSRDGEWVYFSSSEEDVSGMHDVFRVRATGGTPFSVAADRYETEFFAAPSPEPGRVAIASRGRMALSQWWRNGHSHIDESEIWLVEEATASSVPTYTLLSEGGKNLWPMWGTDASRVYFMSDRSGAENLWTIAADGSDERRLTDFDEGRVLWPSMAVERPLITFERDFGIWTYDVEADRARELDIRLLGSVEGPTPEHETVNDGFDDLAVSPDEDKMAFTVRGDVFAASTEGDLPATRVTDTPAEEEDIAWAEDSEEIVYTSWRNGVPQLFAYDFITETERALTDADGRVENPVFSPDGRWLAYGRDDDQLRVVEWETGEDRLLATGTDGADVAWSPDSRWIAYEAHTDEFTNAMVVPVEGGEPRQVSFIANSNFGSLGWSASGEYLLFRTSQRTEPGRLVKVDLVPRTPTFQEDRFWELFNRDETDPERPRPEREPDEETDPGEAGAAAGAEASEEGGEAPPDVEIVFEDIRRRGDFVNTSFSVGSVLPSPDGETAIVTGGGSLYRVTFGPNGDVDFDEIELPGGGGAGSLQLSRDGRRLYMTRGGRVQVLTLGSGNTRTIDSSAEITVDFDREKMAAFEQGWGEMRDGFYDPDMHGADWEAVRRDFAPRIAGARTRAEFGRLMDLMLGELNASHLGHSGGTGPPQGGDGASTGRLGLRFDRLAYEDEGLFRVEEVVELGPADVAGNVEPGDYVLELNGTPLDGETDLHRLLAETAGEKVTARVADDPDGGGARTVDLRPVSGGAESRLVYRNWVEGRRAYVDSISGGRLGYVHIASMSSGALDQLVFDLDQLNHAKDGVVIDVRNNNGGFVNVYALDIFTRENYFTMRTRDGVVAPSRVQLGQRALLAPTVLVTNQHTLSDGEDFTEGYRTLELGSVVGEPTAGWIIYTGSAGLVDGTRVRMPRTEIRGSAGDLMELNPRPVDVEVVRPAGEAYLSRDSQLDRAVEVLLEQIRNTEGG